MNLHIHRTEVMTFLCSCKTQFGACFDLTNFNYLASGKTRETWTLVSTVNSISGSATRNVATGNCGDITSLSPETNDTKVTPTITENNQPFDVTLVKLTADSVKNVASSFRLVCLYLSNTVICLYSLPDLQNTLSGLVKMAKHWARSCKSILWISQSEQVRIIFIFPNIFF